MTPYIMHPEFMAARRAIASASADQRLQTLKAEAERLARFDSEKITNEGIRWALEEAAESFGVSSRHGLETIQHVVRAALEEFDCGLDERFSNIAAIAAGPVSIAHQSRPRPFHRTNTNTIMGMSFDPIKWVVPGYISEGFLVLAGRQKLGKTWLAIDWAVAVATGGCAMGSIACEQGDVLYIDMENGPRRIQSRVNALFLDERNRPDLSRLEWVTEAPQLNAGFIGELEKWRASVPAPRFVVIDVLQRIKPAGSMARNSYENDYSAWAPLQEWATRHGIAVLGLHHTRKGGADDPLEALSGSNGLSACADTTLVLDRDQNGCTLYVRGRDVEERETALVFTSGLWSVLGEAADVRRTDERAVIIEALNDNREPMSPSELATALGKQSNNIKQLLFKMAKAGELYRVGKGRYWTAPVPPVTAITDNPEGGQPTADGYRLSRLRGADE